MILAMNSIWLLPHRRPAENRLAARRDASFAFSLFFARDCG
jgi:hypothetical protein